MQDTIEASILKKLTEHFAPEHLRVENDSHLHAEHGGVHHTEEDNLAEGDSHFRVEIVSEKFQGMPRLARERAVGELFHEERAKGLHAFSVRCYTPTEWHSKQGR